MERNCFLHHQIAFSSTHYNRLRADYLARRKIISQNYLLCQNVEPRCFPEIPTSFTGHETHKIKDIEDQLTTTRKTNPTRLIKEKVGWKLR